MHALVCFAATGLVWGAHAAPIPTPTPQHLKYQLSELVALTHFNMATFYHDGDPGCNPSNWEGPTGSRNVSNFAPTALDTDNWVQSYLDLGAQSAILTAKHGCGFALWPSKTLMPDGSVYPYSVGAPGAIGVDVLAMFAQSCAKAGLGHGFYYSFKDNFFLNSDGNGGVSPNPPLPGMYNVTQEQFESILVHQATELWTNYGTLGEVWFDGGLVSNIYTNVSSLLNQLQPGVIAFNGAGFSMSPIRWVGTESGYPKYPIWSTGADQGGGDPASPVWCPGTTDTTLQEGDHWFYVPGDAIRPLSDLIGVYHASVGQNSVLELDFAIDRTGRVDPVHAARYKEFGDWIRSCYGTSVASVSGTGTSLTLTLTASQQVQAVDRVWVREDQAQGQRIRAYVIEVLPVGSTTWQPFSNGTSVGNKKIDLSGNQAQLKLQALRLNVTAAIAPPVIADFAVFAPCPFA